MKNLKMGSGSTVWSEASTKIGYVDLVHLLILRHQ